MSIRRACSTYLNIEKTGIMLKQEKMDAFFFCFVAFPKTILASCEDEGVLVFM